jgi:hypothetical protein
MIDQDGPHEKSGVGEERHAVRRHIEDPLGKPQPDLAHDGRRLEGVGERLATKRGPGDARDLVGEPLKGGEGIGLGTSRLAVGLWVGLRVGLRGGLQVWGQPQPAGKKPMIASVLGHVTLRRTG